MSKATAGNSTLNWIKKDDGLLKSRMESSLFTESGRLSSTLASAASASDKHLFYLENTVDDRLENCRLIGSYWDSVHDENNTTTTSTDTSSIAMSLAEKADHDHTLSKSTNITMESYLKSGILPTQQRLAGNLIIAANDLVDERFLSPCLIYRNNRDDSYSISATR